MPVAIPLLPPMPPIPPVGEGGDISGGRAEMTDPNQRERAALLACAQGDLTTIAHWPYGEALLVMHDLERRGLVTGIRHAQRVPLRAVSRVVPTDDWTEWHATEAGLAAVATSSAGSTVAPKLRAKGDF